jgi:3-isopropylmalate dehydratase small subunit
VDVRIDVRVARDFGGANVVQALREHGLAIDDPQRTFFTFDCNPTGSDQKYAANQQLCRQFAREHGIRVYDIDAGIGTHLAIDEGLCGPGQTLVSTDSHANILGAIGAFGQGMGDQDIAHAFAHGHVWFKVPPTVRILLKGQPAPGTSAKDVALALLRHFGADGLLGCAGELYGPYVDALDLVGRVTIASMCTEMGGIILLFPPNEAVIEYCRRVREATGSAGASPSRVGYGGPTPQWPMGPSAATASVYADPDAQYERDVTIDIAGLTPLISRPGRPEDVVPVADVAGTQVDSVFIGSCTNGRYEDMLAAARVLRGRRVAPGVVLKIVPATDAIWRRLLADGALQTFKDAGALVGNAGCAGCAAGQIGQNGPGEVTVSTGNRNFAGKQGQGSVYLASVETAAASAIAGAITTADAILAEPASGREWPNQSPSGSEGPLRTRHARGGPPIRAASASERNAERAEARGSSVDRPTHIRGRVWVIRRDNIDTDMIYHNRHLAVTNAKEMGQYAFGNLKGWEDFAKRVRPGDIVVAGKNFGCGSSRQQAVDCFLSLGIAAIVAESFGAIYERNAINAGLAILCAPAVQTDLADGEEVEVDFVTGVVKREPKVVKRDPHVVDADAELAQRGSSAEIRGTPMPDAQLAIYRRGGLL